MISIKKKLELKKSQSSVTYCWKSIFADFTDTFINTRDPLKLPTIFKEIWDPKETPSLAFINTFRIWTLIQTVPASS